MYIFVFFFDLSQSTKYFPNLVCWNYQWQAWWWKPHLLSLVGRDSASWEHFPSLGCGIPFSYFLPSFLLLSPSCFHRHLSFRLSHYCKVPSIPSYSVTTGLSCLCPWFNNYLHCTSTHSVPLALFFPLRPRFLYQSPSSSSQSDTPKKSGIP